MAVRELKTLLYTCDWCRKEIVKTDADTSPFKTAYAYYYGGYGDQERIIITRDLCTLCYKTAIEQGYGSSYDSATYTGNIQT